MPRGKMTEEAKQARRERMEAKKAELNEGIEIFENQLLQDAPLPEDRVMQGIGNMKSADAMNDLALRIFDGQSPDLGKKERVLRIVRGLNAQGYTDMSNLTLPLTDYKHYL